MSNQGNKKLDSIYTTSDDPMLGEDQEVEDTGLDFTDTEDQERARSSNSEGSYIEEGEEDLDSKQRQSDRQSRSRVN